jgi:hypothetical protein
MGDEVAALERGRERIVAGRAKQNCRQDGGKGMAILH